MESYYLGQYYSLEQYKPRDGMEGNSPLSITETKAYCELYNIEDKQFFIELMSTIYYKLQKVLAKNG